MKNNLIFTAVNVGGVLVASVLWLLSTVAPDIFGWYNFSFAVAIVFAVLGISFIIKGATVNERVTSKKANFALGVILLVVAIVALPFAIAIPTNVVPPLVCITIALVAFITIIATKGKKWDMGDNEKEGYKNYYERRDNSEIK